MQLVLKWTLLKELFNDLINYFFKCTYLLIEVDLTVVLSDMFATSIGVKSNWKFTGTWIWYVYLQYKHMFALRMTNFFP